MHKLNVDPLLLQIVVTPENREIIKKADRFEVWASSFLDAGPDFCELHFFYENEIILKVRVDGY